MMNFIDRMVERFTRLNRRLKRWRRGVSVLAAIVVFATTYALVLPAITLDKETASTQAGMEIAAEQIEPEETGTAYESEPEETDSGSESEPAESEDADMSGSEEDEEDSGSDSGSAAAEEEYPEKEPAASKEESDSATNEEGVTTHQNIHRDQQTGCAAACNRRSGHTTLYIGRSGAYAGCRFDVRLQHEAQRKEVKLTASDLDK